MLFQLYWKYFSSNYNSISLPSIKSISLSDDGMEGWWDWRRGEHLAATWEMRSFLGLGLKNELSPTTGCSLRTLKCDTGWFDGQLTSTQIFEEQEKRVRIIMGAAWFWGEGERGENYYGGCRPFSKDDLRSAPRTLIYCITLFPHPDHHPHQHDSSQDSHDDSNMLILMCFCRANFHQ